MRIPVFAKTRHGRNREVHVGQMLSREENCREIYAINANAAWHLFSEFRYPSAFVMRSNLAISPVRWDALTRSRPRI